MSYTPEVNIHVTSCALYWCPRPLWRWCPISPFCEVNILFILHKDSIVNKEELSCLSHYCYLNVMHSFLFSDIQCLFVIEKNCFTIMWVLPGWGMESPIGIHVPSPHELHLHPVVTEHWVWALCVTLLCNFSFTLCFIEHFLTFKYKIGSRSLLFPYPTPSSEISSFSKDTKLLFIGNTRSGFPMCSLLLSSLLRPSFVQNRAICILMCVLI